MRCRFLCVLLCFACLPFCGCSRLGWGILLWATEDPPIPAGTVLPVYIRSNIDRVWVVGIPKSYRGVKDDINKIEIPLAQFEMAGSRGKAHRRAVDFAPYASTYAENMQDGLPIRNGPDNGSRRVYRLRTGEIIKILGRVDGNPAISATGDPLPGDWYRVLTRDGSTGYCFSYRLKLFEHLGGPLQAAPEAGQQEEADPDLDALLSKVWSPESYSLMVNSGHIDIEELEQHWHFDPGQDTGIARIYLPGLDRSFAYTAIRSDSGRAWRFEGANLQMNLRTDTSLAVQYTESSGGMRTLLFSALPADVDDLILQETARRESLYAGIYSQGPVFTSNNYGSIVFAANGTFTWTGFDLLVPQVIPGGAGGGGRVAMDLFLTPSFQDRYTGACTFFFEGTATAKETAVHFMYTLDNQGFRLEAAPDYSIEDNTVTRRESSPEALYFFRDEMFSALRAP